MGDGATVKSSVSKGISSRWASDMTKENAAERWRLRLDQDRVFLVASKTLWAVSCFFLFASSPFLLHFLSSQSKNLPLHGPLDGQLLSVHGKWIIKARYHTGNYTQYLVIIYRENNFKNNTSVCIYIYIYIYIYVESQKNSTFWILVLYIFLPVFLTVLWNINIRDTKFEMYLCRV